jgi:hypothetical protein
MGTIDEACAEELLEVADGLADGGLGDLMGGGGTAKALVAGQIAEDADGFEFHRVGYSRERKERGIRGWKRWGNRRIFCQPIIRKNYVNICWI